LTVLSVRDLRVTFPGGIEAVRGVSFEVAAGEVVGVVGESGSGKTVAALALCGLVAAGARISGSVRIGGTEVVGADPATLRRLRGQEVGFIFQDPATTLNPVLRVGRQIAEGPVVHGQIARRQAGAVAVEALRACDIPDPARRVLQYPHQFSGGMRQRAVIAMALAGRPSLIIADEPTTALDVTVQAQVLAVLRRKQAETGAACLLITHDLGVVAETAGRVLVMYGGRVVETGPVGAIFADPRHPYTRALLRSVPRVEGGQSRLDPIPGQPPTPVDLPPGCAFRPRCPIGRHRAICGIEDPRLEPSPAGEQRSGAAACWPNHPHPNPLPPAGEGDGARTVACHFADEVESAALEQAPAQVGAVGAPLLAVQGLRVHYPVRSPVLRRAVGAVRAVDGVDLVVREGETLGLVGESGCGKTTTGRAIMGLIRPSAGRIMIEGRDVTGLSRRALRGVRRHVQYVFQAPYSSLNPVLSVGEIVAEPMRIHGLYEALGGARRVAEVLELVGLSPSYAGRYAREFSGGQKQRIGIARALALQPRLLILDEPVAALDVSIQAQIVNLLQDLQAELGLAYLFIAHDLAVVRHISHRVAVMYLGRIVEQSETEALFRSPTHPYTQSLLSAVPIPDPAARGMRERIVLQGEIPSPARPPPGCTFHPRCFRASDVCRAEWPTFRPYPGLPTEVACHHAGPPVRAEAA